MWKRIGHLREVEDDKMIGYIDFGILGRQTVVAFREDNEKWKIKIKVTDERRSDDRPKEKEEKEEKEDNAG